MQNTKRARITRAIVAVTHLNRLGRGVSETLFGNAYASSARERERGTKPYRTIFIFWHTFFRSIKKTQATSRKAEEAEFHVRFKKKNETKPLQATIKRECDKVQQANETEKTKTKKVKIKARKLEAISLFLQLFKN